MSYFHRRTLTRRKRNKIKGLIIENGDWCFNDEELKQHVVNFYRDLYIVNYSVSGVFSCYGNFPSLKFEEKRDLLLMVFDDEVRRAIFGGHGGKFTWAGVEKYVFDVKDSNFEDPDEIVNDD
ncbi:hypothetical protein J1N35_030545 [Gossypium stocksii]|uniref:Uncharacterized protein n=1 Tax=Gossypium stocksii TaxID=47602 RepID=A0A9D3ZTZ6_9ROSI|nr:hypothetical protein J1N35_030545 [Gossypium stocksii]